MDKMKVDSHKLMLHPERVLKWRQGEQIYPIYVEISPTSVCNYSCSFCAFDFFTRGTRLDFMDLKQVIIEMGKLGVKSIMFAGEGEPLIHKEFMAMAFHTKAQGIDVAVTTNGSLLTQEMAYEILPVMSWIKVSLNSILPSTFTKMSGIVDRGAGRAMLGTVIKNICQTVDIRDSMKHSCDIGVQMILTEDNVGDIEPTIIAARELGVDYFVIKQYSQHPSSVGITKSPPIYINYEGWSTDTFKVIQRDPLMNKNYDQCYAMPFWSYLSSNGDMYGCSGHIPDSHFVLGSIYKNTLAEMWAKDNYATLIKNIDVSKCRPGCRMDHCNRYLNELVNPGKHVNFI